MFVCVGYSYPHLLYSKLKLKKNIIYKFIFKNIKNTTCSHKHKVFLKK